MPYLKVKTNLDIESKIDFMKRASKLLSTELGKPEQYIMISLEPKSDMLFAGSDLPTAYMELKSIGLPQNKTPRISEALCDFLQEELNIPSNRVYIEFANADGRLWGWNKSTF